MKEGFILPLKVKMRRSFVLITLLIPCIFFHAKAQLDNHLFYDTYKVQEKDSGAIKLGIDISGFFWNNEYSGEITPGYTLFGYQFKPYISFYPSKRIRIDAGGFFLKDFGDSSISDIRPILTIKYYKNNFSFLFGSLEGAASHRLIEPLYYLQHVIDHRIEDGLQFKWVGERVFIDTWLDWVNMIRFGDDEQEVFNVGLSFSYQVYKSKHFQIEIPFQLLANHHGGEIDVNDLPSETLYNTAIGIGFLFPFQNINWLEQITAESFYANYFANEMPALLPYDKGHGFLLNASAKFRWFDLTASYWKGNKFIAPQGTPIYQSVSLDYLTSGYTEDSRELFFVRLMYEHDFAGGLSLAFRFEPVYDFKNKDLDHMEMLFIRYKTDFLLNKKRKK